MEVVEVQLIVDLEELDLLPSFKFFFTAQQILKKWTDRDPI